MSEPNYCAIYSAVFGCREPQDDDDRVLVIRDMKSFEGARNVEQLREMLKRHDWGFNDSHVVKLWNALRPNKAEVKCPTCNGAGRVKES